MQESAGVREGVLRFYERFSAGAAAAFAHKIVHLHFSVGVPDEDAIQRADR